MHQRHGSLYERSIVATDVVGSLLQAATIGQPWGYDVSSIGFVVSRYAMLILNDDFEVCFSLPNGKNLTV